MKYFVTGGTGFVGKAIISSLIENEHDVVVLVREYSNSMLSGVKQVILKDLAELNSLDKSSEEYLTLIDSMSDVDAVIHTAARVHIMNDTSTSPLNEFRKINSEASLSLARIALKAGVKRFIYLSSIKVNGEETQPGKSFAPDDKFVPVDPYGLSKYEAEQGLLALGGENNMEIVIIRPPLVYGPDVKANFNTMLKWVDKSIPLPLGAIYNQRSLVAIENLVDFIIQCSIHPKAGNEVFLISDGQDVSTTELLQKVAVALGRKSKLFVVPVSLMKGVANLLGKTNIANRLFSSLQVDSSKVRDLLGWEPVITMEKQLKKTTEAYLKKKAS